MYLQKVIVNCAGLTQVGLSHKQVDTMDFYWTNAMCDISSFLY